MTDAAVEQLTEESTSLTIQAVGFVITNAEVYGRAGIFVTDLKALEKKALDTFKPMKQKTNEAHKEVCKQEKRVLQPIQSAIGVITQRMKGYRQVQEQQRRAEQARLEAETRQAEEDRRLEAAASLEAAGHNEEAERILEEPQVEAPPPAPRAMPKVEGVSFAEKWTAEVTDFPLLVAAVARGDAPITVLSVNQGVLNRLAEALKGELEFPGVKVHRGEVMRTRASA